MLSLRTLEAERDFFEWNGIFLSGTGFWAERNHDFWAERDIWAEQNRGSAQFRPCLDFFSDSTFFAPDRRQLVGVQRRERHHHDERQEGSPGGHREAFGEGGVPDEAREGDQPAARRQRSGAT